MLEFISISGILHGILKEERRMPRLRSSDIADQPTTVLDMTSLTVEEFELVVPLLKAALQAHMSKWRLDGKP